MTTVPPYKSASLAEVAHLLRRDCAIAQRWHRRLDRLPGARIKWSILFYEVWCHDFADALDSVPDADKWLADVHPSFIDEWQDEAANSSLVRVSKLGCVLAAVVALGCVVSLLADAPRTVIVVELLSLGALLGHTWSRRRLLCGPTACGLMR
jgi:hypothetical protein